MVSLMIFVYSRKSMEDGAIAQRGNSIVARRCGHGYLDRAEKGYSPLGIAFV
jgi:hypothetical protein